MKELALAKELRPLSSVVIGGQGERGVDVDVIHKRLVWFTPG